MTILKPLSEMMGTARLVGRLARLKLLGEVSNQANDYDNAAPTYDAYTGSYLGRIALEFGSLLPVQPGDQVLDLPCGTGVLTPVLARAVGHGKVLAVDLSPGMLETNRRKSKTLGLRNVEFYQADAIEYLARLQPGSLDGVVCGWGLCYFPRQHFLRQVARVLRPDGFLGILENSASTLHDALEVFQQVLLQRPQALSKTVVNIDLPVGASCLAAQVRQWGFSISLAREGSLAVPCACGREAMEYLERGGVGAGYFDALAPAHRDAVRATFADLWDATVQHRPLVLRHDYTCVLATRSGTSPSWRHELMSALGAWAS